MNSIDTKVIRQLMERGRTTWAELGALLGLSAPAAADRVRRLEEAGTIRGYTALIDPEAAGCGLAALISVSLERPGQKEEFLDMIRDLPEILECHHVAGEDDYSLKVRCSGTRDLEELISARIKSLPGVRTRTTVILSTYKDTPVLPVRNGERQ
ncbi:MAG: Lrp/AsnC family transcriptional regulator [Thermovirgaceae bacterium]|nr:Lrp/AsnC family transcriptional regulator [Thermovirgaceae bacterium]